jgi:hypothetical protein
MQARPHLVFRSTARDATYGRVALAARAAPGAERVVTSLECDRVYFAAGKGLCLTADRGVFTTYRAYTFDERFAPGFTFPLAGLPSRARLSPDGRYAAMTVFVSGHSYADTSFSTQTTLIETESGTLIGDLEQFTVWRDGSQIQSPDFNFWGVTFAQDSNRFYATLSTGGIKYLVEGDLAGRQVRIVHENVECPSLSPDNTRLVFKRQVSSTGGRLAWQLRLLDLATLTETPLTAETRSVDDQVEWLDDDRILYALPDEDTQPTPVTNTWVLPVDGSATPQVFVPQAYSPAAVQ